MPANKSLHTLTLEDVAIHRSLLARRDLTPSAKLLWEWIWRFQTGTDARARKQGRPRGCVYPSVATIAKALGLSSRTIRRQIKCLQDAGLLEVTHRPPNAVRRDYTTNCYRARWSAPVIPLSVPVGHVVSTPPHTEVPETLVEQKVPGPGSDPISDPGILQENQQPTWARALPPEEPLVPSSAPDVVVPLWKRLGLETDPVPLLPAKFVKAKRRAGWSADDLARVAAWCYAAPADHPHRPRQREAWMTAARTFTDPPGWVTAKLESWEARQHAEAEHAARVAEEKAAEAERAAEDARRADIARFLARGGDAAAALEERARALALSDGNGFGARLWDTVDEFRWSYRVRVWAEGLQA